MEGRYYTLMKEVYDNTEIYKGLGSFKLSQILNSLRKRFPDGFKSRDARKFLENKFGSFWQGFNITPFFRTLVSSNLLKIKSSNKFESGITHYTYEVVSPKDIMETYKGKLARIIDDEDAINQVNPEFGKLLSAYVDSEGWNQVEESLCDSIKNNRHFTDFMADIKTKTPGLYRRLGGEYLDRLIKEK
jgi:hypothetical protein